ncbi:hypothetical protein AWL63_05740 [Sphingomonas panacis]|uniref:Uncharacterized protein n=2 Tax=Sphingomonas panacis TaxID=1560345 RepID=A0A1B3Z7Y5_9SPHN|nr:hypothetical protein AWL63_05740 [Sphingomonas panacis]
MGETMTLRAILGRGVLAGWVLGMAGCATPPVKPPPVVATVPPPPPQMPAGGYIGMKIPHKLADGTYVTPNIANTDQAAVWHLRNALNVAALGCDHAGGGIVEPYNAWLTTHAAVLDHYLQAYRHEWQATGWWDWERVYDNNQTRIYNFYSQPTMRAAFCAVARGEIAQVGQVADADLPAFARKALLRLDKPFVDFYAAFDAWRDYYEPAPPPVVRTIDTPIAVATPAPVATLDGNAPVTLGTMPLSAPTPGDTPVASATPSPQATGSAPLAGVVPPAATAP